MRSARSLMLSTPSHPIIEIFCQFIKGVKLPDGFGSNFKHKVTDNDSNIMGMKSHDCPIMMQQLLPYGLQQYLDTDIAKPIIKLCSFFKQICSRTLMEDDMVKAESQCHTPPSQLVDILCYLEQIYPPSFFDIMIHLVIHLPQEALEGGPIPYQWISISKRSIILLDHQELKKVIWYVLHNSPEIVTYLAKFKRKFPNQDMKEEFPDWFGPQIRQRYIDKNPSISNKLFTLACGPTSTSISVNSCVVIGVRFVVHSCDECHTTQNNGICSPGEKDGEMYYGQLEEILEILESFKDQQYILGTQVKQVFYLEDMARRLPHWKVVQDVNHKKFSNRGVIVVEDDHDVIHDNNSSDLALSATLNDLDFATLNIYGQSADVEEPPDIIDVDEDNDFNDDEDGVPHDLVDFNDEVLANNDDDDVAVVYSSEEEN
ncbi:reverse transcriptase domain-containing protein [Tanacetum coccineum]